MKLRILVAGLMFGIGALADDIGAELFQKAVTQEQAAGNLEQAIKLYQRIVTEFATDRPLVAKALVQEARCYEKLGQTKAVKIYEQVAREYSDQREPVAAANARLIALRMGDHSAVPATLAQRKIELPYPPLNGRFLNLDTDGQRQVYKDEATGDLMASDLAGGNKRIIYKPNGKALGWGFASRDSSMFAMRLAAASAFPEIGDELGKSGGSQTVAVIRGDGGGFRDTAIDSDCPGEWSWDNRYLLLCQPQSDGSRELLRYSVRDGDILKLGKAEGINQRYSPDGRFIAYGIDRYAWAPGKIFVIPSQGGEPRLVHENARLMDWTRDGRFLMVVTNRSGSEALLLIPMKDGKAFGEPIFVRYGSFESGRTSASGAFIYDSTIPGGRFTEWLGTFNSDGNVESWKHFDLTGSNPGGTPINWSPDSTQIVYGTSNSDAGQNAQAVRLRNIGSGDDRQIYQSTNEAFCAWAAHSPTLFCGTPTPQNTTEVISVSTDSGRSERLGSIPGSRLFLRMSSDDQAIYAESMPTPELIRWDISSHQITVLDHSPDLLPSLQAQISPDGRWIARLQKGDVEIRLASGGTWRFLCSLGGVTIGTITQNAFTYDGNWFMFRKLDATGKPALFRVSTAGGQPQRIGDFPGSAGFMYISPDGKRIITQVIKPVTSEVWMLENFEPKT